MADAATSNSTNWIDQRALESILGTEFHKKAVKKGFSAMRSELDDGFRKSTYYTRDLGTGNKEFLFPDGIGTPTSRGTGVTGTYYVQVPNDAVERFVTVVHAAYRTSESASIGAGTGLVGTALGLYLSENMDSAERGLVAGLSALVSLFIGYVIGETASGIGMNKNREALRKELEREDIIVSKSAKNASYDHDVLGRIKEVPRVYPRAYKR